MPTKLTKKDQFNTLISLIDYAEQNGATVEGGFDNLRKFVEHEIVLLENKQKAAAARAEEKRIAGDELREQIYNILPGPDEDFMPIDAIVDALNDSEITRNMVASRLTQLGKLDQVSKETISVGEKNRKVSGYRKSI